MTLYELTSAYSAFANMGTLIKPTAIRNIKSRKGELLFTSVPERAQPISPGTAHIITSLLQSVIKNGTATKVKALKRPVAGKTGTTNNYVDAWFMGYTPELVTGVWVGKDKDEPLGRNETGSRAAIPIWLQYMQEALANRPKINFPVPANIQFLKVQSKSGELAKFDDTDTKFELFSQDFLPGKEQPFTQQLQEELF
jgi:penicillin-binding protein 1A